MSIDPSAVGVTTDPVRRSWTSKDALLYAVGVGAGQDPLDELAFTTENSRDVEQLVLPTLAIVVGFGGGLDKIGTYDRTKLVHGGQAVELHRPIPIAGEIECVGEITGIYDKGSGALVEITSRSSLVDADGKVGEPLFTTVGSFFIREAGEFGGDRVPAKKVDYPERRPDETVTYTTRPEQALIYRLSGDRNPLHADPTFAARAGFDRPILHGLCTYGFTGRALLHALCDGDPARFRSMNGRFSKPVMPGDELRISIWRTADGEAIYRTETADGGVVLDDGTCTFA